MTGLMLDGIDADAPAMAAYPGAISYVAGYVDGRYAWSSAHWALFPNSTHVRIAVLATTDDGHVLDCEPGNCTPAQAVDWVLMRRRAGTDPTVYCNELDSLTGWPAVRAAFRARRVPEPHYWVANYSVDQNNPRIPPGAVALQYRDAGPYDLSVVADHWPGVDPPPEADMTPDESRLLANTERILTCMCRYAGGDASARQIPGILYAVGGAPVTLLNPVAALEDLVAKMTVATPAIDAAVLRTQLVAALTDPGVLKAQAHAAAVEVHGDTPAA